MWSRHGSDGFLATFICSNIVPQRHRMNAGVWEELESLIAGRPQQGNGWAEHFGDLLVITGPVYGANPDHLRTGIAVPAACFSIIIDGNQETGQLRAIAFQIPNRDDARGPLHRWITTIKAIEQDTGLDFFAGPAVVHRARLEHQRAERLW